MSHAVKGHQVLLARKHDGRHKIKVKYGPFGLITARYSTDRQTYDGIKARLKKLPRHHHS